MAGKFHPAGIMGNNIVYSVWLTCGFGSIAGRSGGFVLIEAA